MGVENYPANHPVWKLARLIVVGVILLGCLAFVYAGLDQRDLITLIATLAGLGGYDLLKAKVTKPKDHSTDDGDESDAT